MPVDVFQNGARSLSDVRAVAGGRGQGGACDATVLRLFFAVRVVGASQKRIIYKTLLRIYFLLILLKNLPGALSVVCG